MKSRITNPRHRVTYVITPNGSLKNYDVSSNTEKTVTTKLPSDPNDPDRKNKTNPVENPERGKSDFTPPR
ncbi:hypothetical protein CMT74_02505 [Elizabethkingia anophelis]|nr:hypothetical protein [Elizabethkingia anophelis]